MASVSILTSLTASCDILLNLHSIYSILVLLSLKPLESRIYLQTSRLSKNLQRMSCRSILYYLQITYTMRHRLENATYLSVTKANRNELKVDLWCNHITIEKFSEPPTILTWILAPMYMSLFVLMYVRGTPLNSTTPRTSVEPLVGPCYMSFLGQ